MDIKYRVSPTSAFEVFKQFKNLENVNNVLLSSLVQRAIESVTTKYNVIDILGEKRNDVYIEIEKVVKERLATSGIDFFSLVLLDTDAGAAIESAIEAEAVAKKAVETAAQVQAKAQVEAQTKVLQATAAAEVQIIEANASAEVKTINAEAEAEANRKISASLTEQLLRKMEMEARIKHGWIEIMGADAIVVK
jgi:regulator of protease activity HflC (stomatin/prohibitin superfamily)